MSIRILGIVAALALAACSSQQRAPSSSDPLLRASCFGAWSARTWQVEIDTAGRYGFKRGSDAGWSLASSGRLRSTKLHALEATIAKSGVCEIAALEHRFSCDDVSTYALEVRCASGNTVALDFDECLRPSTQRSSLQWIFSTLRGLFPRLARGQECAFVGLEEGPAT
jgi:hypothetical protein